MISLMLLPNSRLIEDRTSELPKLWKGRLFCVKYVEESRSPTTMSLPFDRTRSTIFGASSRGYVSSPSTMI